MSKLKSIGIMLVTLLVFIGLVISGIKLVEKYRSVNTKVYSVDEVNDVEIDESKLTPIQSEIAEEVFERFEDDLYDRIVMLDESQNYESIEEYILHILHNYIGEELRTKLIAKVGEDEYHNVLNKIMFKIRGTIDKKFDEDYVTEIINIVEPKLRPYRYELLRRTVIDSAYARLTDEQINSIADEIVSLVRDRYAEILKEKAIRESEELFNNKNK